MKIAQVIDTLEVGGAEKVLISLANEQFRRQNEVLVITIKNQGPLAKNLEGGVQLFSLNRKTKYSLFALKSLYEKLRIFDVIHVHSIHNLKYVRLCLVIFCSKKLVYYHEHNGNVINRDYRFWHDRFLYRNVRFIGVSEKICSWASRVLKIEKSNILYLPNVIDKKSNFASKRNYKQRPFKLVVVSNIKKLKNLELAIRIIANSKELILTIIGRIVEYDYYCQLTALIQELNLNNRVNFICDCDDPTELLVNFHAAVHTSHYESGPLVLLEYFAAGLPFLTFETGDVAISCKETFPSMVIDNYDEENWISRLTDLLNNHSEEKSEEMVRYFDERFSIERYYNKCKKFYLVDSF